MFTAEFWTFEARLNLYIFQTKWDRGLLFSLRKRLKNFLRTFQLLWFQRYLRYCEILWNFGLLGNIFMNIYETK